MAAKLTPIPRVEHEQKIKKSCPILQPTGCTPQFCQAGRLSRPLEPKLGENRPIDVIKSEARAFLLEMFEELGDVTVFEDRLKEVMEEIDAGAKDAKVWIDQESVVHGRTELERVEVDGVTSSGWYQTEEEIAWGVKVAWRNSRKCIMRAHYQDLL